MCFVALQSVGHASRLSLGLGKPRVLAPCSSTRACSSSVQVLRPSIGLVIAVIVHVGLLSRTSWVLPIHSASRVLAAASGVHQLALVAQLHLLVVHILSVAEVCNLSLSSTCSSTVLQHLLLAADRRVAHIEMLRRLACALLHLSRVHVFLLALEVLHIDELALILLAIYAIGNVLL